MRAVFLRLRPFLIALVCSWVALFVAASVYSAQYPQSHWIMQAALPAFLVEAVFYLGAGFESTRDWFQQIGSRRLAAWLLLTSALLPYVIFSFRAGTFQKNAFYLLAGLSATYAFWHVIFPRRIAYDLGFLVVAAAPVVVRFFARIYRSPDEHIRVDILGHLMWIRLGMLALLCFREWNPGAFGFWPQASEWRTGIAYYLVTLIPLMGVSLAVHDVRFAPQQGQWWRLVGIALGYFFGAFWVTALGEELFFRGVIERALLRNTRKTAAVSSAPPQGLRSSFPVWRRVSAPFALLKIWNQATAVLVSALLFGVAHLWFHQFPDWREAAVVAVLGIALGVVYARTGSVRASMVTHACVVATWRVFFK